MQGTINVDVGARAAQVRLAGVADVLPHCQSIVSEQDHASEGRLFFTPK